MFFRLFFGFLLVISGFLYAQDGFPGMVGNYGDVKFISPQTLQKNEFAFARLIYNGKINSYNKNWYTDYPQGDRTIIDVVRRITGIDIALEERAISIQNPELFNYPMIYSSEAGQMVLDGKDIERLKEYFLRGGFWMIDDFWGTQEWDSFEREIKKVFPKSPIVELSIDHPIFHVFFEIEKIVQVPVIRHAYTSGSNTWEEDGYEPKVRGVFDDNGRLAVVIFFNTDTMDAAEWADDPVYPHHFSTYAYKIFINTIVYAMTH